MHFSSPVLRWIIPFTALIACLASHSIEAKGGGFDAAFEKSWVQNDNGQKEFNAAHLSSYYDTKKLKYSELTDNAKLQMQFDKYNKKRIDAKEPKAKAKIKVRLNALKEAMKEKGMKIKVTETKESTIDSVKSLTKESSLSRYDQAIQKGWEDPKIFNSQALEEYFQEMRTEYQNLNDQKRKVEYEKLRENDRNSIYRNIYPKNVADDHLRLLAMEEVMNGKPTRKIDKKLAFKKVKLATQTEESKQYDSSKAATRFLLKFAGTAAAAAAAIGIGASVAKESDYPANS